MNGPRREADAWLRPVLTSSSVTIGLTLVIPSATSSDPTRNHSAATSPLLSYRIDGSTIRLRLPQHAHRKSPFIAQLLWCMIQSARTPGHGEIRAQCK